MLLLNSRSFQGGFLGYKWKVDSWERQGDGMGRETFGIPGWHRVDGVEIGRGECIDVCIHMIVCTSQTGGEFLDEERKFHGVPPLNLTSLEYSQYCYDATWTLAYALNETLRSK